MNTLNTVSMKKIISIGMILLFTLPVMAQRFDGQRMRLLKISFLTNAIDLTPEEAEKFWPIYNKYNAQIVESKNALDRGLFIEFSKGQTLDDLSEEEAEELLAELTKREQALLNQRAAMHHELRKVLSAKKLVLLVKAERDFNRRILQEFGRRNRPGRGN
jgi:uncharacterized protein YwgA